MSDEPDNNPEVSFGENGFNFKIGNLTSGKIAIVFAAVSSIVGAMWGGFQVYQQFLTMKEVTAAYVPPDLSGITSQIQVLQERATSVERLAKGNSEALNYLTGSISSSVNGTRQTVDAVSSSVRSSDAQNLAMQRAIMDQLRQQDQQQQARIRDQEAAQQSRIKQLEADVNDRIQKTLANPLAGRE